MKQVELLSPAGSAEGLEAALRFGADAVYLGGPFLQLRAASAGFDREELCAAVAYAHSLGKKVYVTVNAFAGDEDILALGDYARFLADAGADAAIVVVADPTLADTWVEDCSIVMANMHLEAAASGVGSCWIQGRLRQAADGRSTHEFVANLLKVPAPCLLYTSVEINVTNALRG